MSDIFQVIACADNQRAIRNLRDLIGQGVAVAVNNEVYAGNLCQHTAIGRVRIISAPMRQQYDRIALLIHLCDNISQYVIIVESERLDHFRMYCGCHLRVSYADHCNDFVTRIQQGKGRKSVLAIFQHDIGIDQRERHLFFQFLQAIKAVIEIVVAGFHRVIAQHVQ